MDDKRCTQAAFIIPVYNEALNIGPLIQAIGEHMPSSKIVVIDDGSSDDSATIARANGAQVISHLYNLGIGGAVQTGYIYASRQNFDIIIRLDGDGQHDPEQVNRLLRPLLTGEADIVVGSRYKRGSGYKSSFIRFVGIKLFATVMSLATGHEVTDPTSGLMVMKSDAAAFLAKHLPQDYPEIEGRLLLLRAGFRVREVPVDMFPRSSGKSSITPWRSFYYVVKVLLAIGVELLRRPTPKGVFS